MSFDLILLNFMEIKRRMYKMYSFLKKDRRIKGQYTKWINNNKTGF